MIVFATVKCSRFETIRSDGFDAKEDGGLARHETGMDGIFCTDYPEPDADWPPDFHMALVLDVPDEVLKKYRASIGIPGHQVGTPNDLDQHSEFWAHMGWVLPADIATKYLHEQKLGIDLGVITSGGLTSLDSLEEDETSLGFFDEIGSIVKQRHRARRAHRDLELGNEGR